MTVFLETAFYQSHGPCTRVVHDNFAQLRIVWANQPATNSSRKWM